MMEVDREVSEQLITVDEMLPALVDVAAARCGGLHQPGLRPRRGRPRAVADHFVRRHDRRDDIRRHPDGAQAHRTGPVHRLPAATTAPNSWPAALLATGLFLIHIVHRPANDVPASAPFGAATCRPKRGRWAARRA